MKKIISIVTVIALVLSMSVMAFAAEKPTGDDLTPEALGEYYAALINEGEDITAVVEEIVADYENGDIDSDSILTVFTTMISEVEDTQAVITVIEEVTAMLEDMGISIPDVTLPDIGDITLPDIGDITLPGGDDDDSSSGGSSFLDTILGALGGIGDIIFGGGSSGGDDDDTPSIDGDDTGDLWGDGDDAFNDADLGDMSIVAVATVAVVAGAALVLTRKKSDDAE